MSRGHHHRSPRSRRWVIVRGLIVAIMAAGILVTSAGAVGAASEGCGSTSYGFTGTRLLNDGISDSAGPFTIDLPAGTYDITMRSNDNHPSPDYQVEQTQEQWYFSLDNGYVSPPTLDVPADQTEITTTLGPVELEAATAITVHHLGEGNINSVNVECVGFTLAAPVVAGPATTTTVAVAPPATAAPTTVAQVAPETTTEAPAAVTTTEAPETEVLAVTETPQIAQLAVTGRTNNFLVGLGIVIFAIGVGCLYVEHRLTHDPLAG